MLSRRNPFLREPEVRVVPAPLRPVTGLEASDASGRSFRVPLDESIPDAHSIVGTLQFVVDQNGRDPAVRQFAIDHILSSRRQNANWEHFHSIIDFVRSRVVYLADPDRAELVMTAPLMLSRIAAKGFVHGDCDDHVVLAGALLTSIGIPVRVVGVQIGGSELFNHVILSANVNGRWINVDPTDKERTHPTHYPAELRAR